ncbi:MAG TPA: M15 family metallopeptidase [Candidatus Acidoferrales bacterium]|nr:M15 family metallopeptidase [Candidatus Acidoferrales bacterium]
MPARLPQRSGGFTFPLALVLFALTATSVAQTPSVVPSQPPPDAPVAWKELIGEYTGPQKKTLTIYEDAGKLRFAFSTPLSLEVSEITRDAVIFAKVAAQPPARILRGAQGSITGVTVGSDSFERRDLPAGERSTLLVKPVRPISELRTEALAASPPRESGAFRQPDLVELALLDPAIHLDIRYATSNDFLGTPVYTQARAFLQRPAAESLVRALRALEARGYGLLIHDAYRPWFVTKIFWDATPPEGKIFVADPAQGSRHNRGCAVDLTLYDLRTGKPIEMPGTYDEMSPRSFPAYIGGSSLQRWHRDLLRQAMEAQGFTVYEYEWWHFDYKDWREYPILNIPFEKLAAAAASSVN